jgi:hypothetical protein
MNKDNKKLPTLKELEGKYQPEELKDLTDKEVLEVFKGVETVWDYDISDIEKRQVGIDQYSEKVEYLRKRGFRPDGFNGDIFSILLLRGEDEKAEKYFNLVKDREYKEILESKKLPFDIVP